MLLNKIAEVYQQFCQRSNLVTILWWWTFQNIKGQDMAQMIDHMPKIWEVLSFVPSTA